LSFYCLPPLPYIYDIQRTFTFHVSEVRLTVTMDMRIICILFLSAMAAFAQRRIPIIFDTDIGDDIDDALALCARAAIAGVGCRAVTTVADDVEAGRGWHGRK